MFSTTRSGPTARWAIAHLLLKPTTRRNLPTSKKPRQLTLKLDQFCGQVIAAALERFLAEHIGGRYQAEMPDDIAAKLQALIVDVNTVEMPDTDP